MTLKDLKSLPGDGYFIMPISMSKATNPSQDPKTCYEMIEHVSDKCEELSNDLIFLYTSELYFNTEQKAYNMRKKVTQQLLSHRNGIDKLIRAKKRFIPNAFHYLTFDFILANSKEYDEYLKKLLAQYQSDDKFKRLVKDMLDERSTSEANVRFILEETIVSHLIRTNATNFPRTLVRKDKWRLIAYPDPYLKLDAYIWQNKILPRNANHNIYANNIYDSKNKILYDLNKVKV